jgi:cyclic pyranopterin phosphate synthase
MSDGSLLSDSFGRVMRDLRVSVTDRCNFRCLYCLPETEEAANFYRSKFDPIKNSNPVSFGLPPLKPKSEILSFEEIERLVRLSVDAGIEKIRLTGGEPLLRQNLEALVARLAPLPGLKDLAITTNGFLFAKKGAALKAAGLKRVSFSMDSLNRENFQKMTGRDGLNEVLAGIRLARDLGLNPVKVNAVIIRGLNDHEIEDLAEFAMRENISLRFIEFMPLDSSRGWLKDMVVPGREILQRLISRFGLNPVSSNNSSETAKRWAFPGSAAEIGIIAPVTEPFCGHCNRIRLTADGKIRTCLFSISEHDLKRMLRGGADDRTILAKIRAIVWQKEDRHHIGEADFQQPARSMSCIGG